MPCILLTKQFLIVHNMIGTVFECFADVHQCPEKSLSEKSKISFITDNPP